MTIPAFWPPLRPDGPPRPATGGAGSGAFVEGEGASGGELGFRIGAGVGEVGGNTGDGVGAAGEREFGDGVGTGWASKDCNKFVNKKLSSKKFKNLLLIILSILFFKPNTIYVKVNKILSLLKGDY